MSIFHRLFANGFFASARILFLLWAMLLTACPNSQKGPESQFVMGTVCSINLYEKGKPELYSRVFARLRELEGILSANQKDTDLDRVNQNAAIGAVKVRGELLKVLERALEYAEKSNGYFDPSVGPLVKLWGIGTDSARIPGQEEITEVLNLVDFRDIEINKKEGSVFLRKSGMALDLGAIAKGYAADEIAKLLVQ
ncbi:MAG: FAD:protein FMN transferase, partial [Treponema sp.]|nr:FAD:protein FMN transferase [Treponema sp.]